MDGTTFESQLDNWSLQHAVSLWLTLLDNDEPVWSTWYKDGYADVEGVTFRRALDALHTIEKEGYEGYITPHVVTS